MTNNPLNAVIFGAGVTAVIQSSSATIRLIIVCFVNSGIIDNPVDWYPWCSEAFEKAHKEDKTVFLSIGYSTCHWCHVMAHESFEEQMTKYH